MIEDVTTRSMVLNAAMAETSKTKAKLNPQYQQQKSKVSKMRPSNHIYPKLKTISNSIS